MSFTTAITAIKNIDPATVSIGQSIELIVNRQEGNDDDGIHYRHYCVEKITRNKEFLFLEFAGLNLNDPVEIILQS